MTGLATKKDFLFASIIGILFGIFAIPILENLKPPFWHLNFLSAAFLIVGFLVIANIAIWLAGLIGKKFPTLWQFAKYAASGALSSTLDVGILNFLSLVFRVFSGSLIVVFNTFSVLAAITNSYLWNKHWAFKKGGEFFDLKEYLKFVGVTAGSLVLGTAIVYVMTTFIALPHGISQQLWENIAKVISLPVVVAWNYIFYKFVIFKK